MAAFYPGKKTFYVARFVEGPGGRMRVKRLGRGRYFASKQTAQLAANEANINGVA